MQFPQAGSTKRPAGALLLLVVAAAWGILPTRSASQDIGTLPPEPPESPYDSRVQTGPVKAWEPATEPVPPSFNPVVTPNDPGRAPRDAALQARLDRLESEVAEIREEQPSVFPLDRFARQFRSGGAREYPTVNWSGFLQVDSGWFVQDTASKAAIGDLEDKLGLRRVRLRAYGHIRRATTYVIDLDFAASGHPSFRDVMLRFHEVPLLQNIQFGYFQQPFSMNAETSGQDLDFLERWLPFAFAPFRQTGLAAHGTFFDERMQWGISAFRFPTDSYGSSEGGSGGYALATRVTCLPLYLDEGDRLVHVGFSYSHGDPGDNLVQYQIQSGFFVTDSSGSADVDGGNTGVPVFVDTGPIPTNTFHLFNAELAGSWGPFHAQSELTVAVVDERGGPTVAFSGAYAQIGCFLTGESRPYDRKKGVFSQPEPIRGAELGGTGLGAFEVVAGWSYIDLSDKNVQGGELNGYILGLNWYLSRLAKMQVMYMHSFLDDPDTGASDVKTVAVRAQFKF